MHYSLGIIPIVQGNASILLTSKEWKLKLWQCNPVSPVLDFCQLSHRFIQPEINSKGLLYALQYFMFSVIPAHILFNLLNKVSIYFVLNLQYHQKLFPCFILSKCYLQYWWGSSCREYLGENSYKTNW